MYLHTLLVIMVTFVNTSPQDDSDLESENRLLFLIKDLKSRPVINWTTPGVPPKNSSSRNDNESKLKNGTLFTSNSRLKLPLNCTAPGLPIVFVNICKYKIKIKNNNKDKCKSKEDCNGNVACIRRKKLHKMLCEIHSLKRRYKFLF